MIKRLRVPLAAAVVGAAAVLIPVGTGAAAAAGCDASVAALENVCTASQFDLLFAYSHDVTIPVDAVYNGMVRPLSGPNPVATAAAGALWQGKHFYRGWLNNRLDGLEALPADVFVAPSAIDGRPVLRVDYRRAGIPAGHDELRRLPNGVYVGYGFLNNAPGLQFWIWR